MTLNEALQEVVDRYNGHGTVNDGTETQCDGRLDLYSLQGSGYQPKASQACLDQDDKDMEAAYTKDSGKPWEHEDEACQDWESDWKTDGPAIWLSIEVLENGNYLAEMSNANNYVQNGAWARYEGTDLQAAIDCLSGA